MYTDPIALIDTEFQSLCFLSLFLLYRCLLNCISTLLNLVFHHNFNENPCESFGFYGIYGTDGNYHMLHLCSTIPSQKSPNATFYTIFLHVEHDRIHQQSWNCLFFMHTCNHSHFLMDFEVLILQVLFVLQTIGSR